MSKLSKRKCCVAGCLNTSVNTNNVKFFGFPNKPHEKELKELWIQAINQIDSDGKLWQPLKSSVICGDHFINNKPVKHPQSSAYIPTIFNKKKTQNNRQRESSHKRKFNHKDKKNELHQDELSENANELSGSVPDSTNLTCDASTQVAFDNSDVGTFNFDCTFFNNNAMTQISGPSFATFCNTKKIDQSCGPDNQLSDITFHGFKSIKNEQQLKDLTGTTFQVFNLLLKFFAEPYYYTYDKENRLLIFLMKIKSGMSFTAISSLFNTNSQTIIRIFHNTLNILAIKTKRLIYWPSKFSVRKTLPKEFRENYPNCRCIIKCIEIKTEVPNTSEQKEYLYSRNKGTYTFKVLVAISPHGTICFLSNCYGGKVTNAFITENSNFLSKLDPEDVVLADKEFAGINIEGETDSKRIIVMPPEDVVFGEKEFAGVKIKSETDSKRIIVMPTIRYNGKCSNETETMVEIRIHMDKVFSRLKAFNILNKIPMNLISSMDNIMHICCVLNNLQDPVTER